MTASHQQTEAGAVLAVLAGVLGPDLPDTECVGYPELFDPPGPDEHPDDVDYRRRAACRICRACPVLADCADLVDGFTAHPFSHGFVLAAHVVTGRRL